MRRNGFGPSSEWKFQMFKWKNVAQHEQFIYLHCQGMILFLKITEFHDFRAQLFSASVLDFSQLALIFEA